MGERSGLECRLWEQLGLCRVWVRGEAEEEVEEEEGGGQGSCSLLGFLMYTDWMLSLRRPGCSLFLTRLKLRWPGGLRVRPEAGVEAGMEAGVEAGVEARASFIVPGRTGWRRCTWSLKAELKGEEEEKTGEEEEEEGEVGGVGLRLDGDRGLPLSRRDSSEGFR